MKLLNHILTFGLTIVSCSFTSCSPDGRAFSPVKPQPGKGVVYVYRKPDFVGWAAEGPLKVNGVPVTILKNGGYFPYVGPPGDTHFTTKIDWNRKAIIRMEEGKSKYLKAEFAGPTARVLELSQVPASVGATEITECRLLEPLSR